MVGFVQLCGLVGLAHGLLNDPSKSPFDHTNLDKPTVVHGPNGGANIYLFDEAKFTPGQQNQIEETFDKVLTGFENKFDYDAHNTFLAIGDNGVRAVPTTGSACGGGGALTVPLTSVQSFRKSNRWWDLSKIIDKMAEKAMEQMDPGSVNGLIAMQAIMMGAMFLQSAVASAIHIIPPLIPPPIWNNQPIFCLPMLTGHNCFGAVLYPISTADFVIADATDRQLDAYITSFPQTYKEKVGATVDIAYKACFSAYMSMHCSSLFPMCMAPQTGDDLTTKAPQRVPMCFTLCIATLVMCPGFWIDDVIGPCEDISIPPMCSHAFFWRFDLLPPQYSEFDLAMPESGECPEPASADEYAGLKELAAGGAAAGGAGAGAAGVAVPGA